MPIRERTSDGVRGARVRHIAEMMSRGDWTGSRYQRRMLAQDWKCSPSTVRHYAAEAHRLLVIPPEERAEMRKLMALRFSDIAARARKAKSKITGMPDFKSEIEAWRQYAEFSGLLEPGARAPETKPSRIELVMMTPDDAQKAAAATQSAEQPDAQPAEAAPAADAAESPGASESESPEAG